MDRDKQQFVDLYLESPDKYCGSPYMDDPEVINAVMNPAPPPSLVTPIAEDFLKHAANYAMLGAVEKDLAQFFSISIGTLRRWLETYPEFAEAIQIGNDYADARVEQAMFHRAIGYEHPDVHISNFQGLVTITSITKYYPPDVKAGLAWLYNRRPDEWKDKRSVDYTIEVLSPDDRKAKILEYQERLRNNGPITIDQSPELTV